MNYNGRFTRRWNKFIGNKFIMPKLRKRLRNTDVTILANNCNAGFIYHDLGLQFLSPTINLFFQRPFFTFLEHLEDYLKEEIRECKSPLHQPELPYPVCNLGGGNPLTVIELHFNHYHGFQEAHDTWEKRKLRINPQKIFALFAFTDDTDESWLKRFDRIPLKNKIALVNRPFLQYPSAYYIPGFEATGIGMAGDYDNLLGRRKYDHFDFVKWLNNN